MAAKYTVTGDQDLSIDKQMREIKRQLRQKGGSPINPEDVIRALQDISEGKFKASPAIQKAIASFLKIKQTGIVIPGLSEKFVPKEKFGENSEVKYYIGDSFKTHLLDETQPFDSLSGVVVDKSVLEKQTTDKEIMSAIGVSETEGLLSKEEILYHVSYLTEKQANGEKGLLLTDGSSTIIGYFLCSDGVVRVAGVYWDVVRWHCIVRDLDRWRAGREVLSRNGILKS